MPLPNEASFNDTFTMEPGAATQYPVEPERPRPRRTFAEQADFDARVEALAKIKRDEAEQAEVEEAARAKHEAAMRAREDEKVAEEKSQAELQAEANRHAAIQAHPHTQLRDIIASLRAPTALDVNGRIGILHAAVARLAQVILQHTPPPQEEQHNGEGHSIDGRQPIEGADEQIG